MSTVTGQFKQWATDGRVIRAIVIGVLALLALFYLGRVSGIITSSRLARQILPQPILIPTPVFVEPSLDDKVIYPGETVRAELGSGELHAWVFSGARSEVVDILLQPTGRYDASFDPVLELFGPGGVSLARVDRQAGNGAELLAGFALPEPGDYTVWVGDLNYTGSGQYALRVLSTRAKYTYPLRFGVGQLVRGDLERDAYQAWVFAAKAGQRISLTVIPQPGSATQSGFRPIAELLAPDGRLVASAAAPEPLATAVARDIALDQDGDYTIWVHADGFAHAGQLVLSVQYVQDKGVAAP